MVSSAVAMYNKAILDQSIIRLASPPEKVTMRSGLDITPEYDRYLRYCDYMSEIYGPHWATRVRLKDISLDKMDLEELERRKTASDDSRRAPRKPPQPQRNRKFIW